MRRLAIAVALLLLGAGCAGAASAPEVTARPLPRAEGIAPGARLGELALVAALELGSRHPRFGGLSGLLVEGARLTAVSDRGSLWEATLRHDGRGTLVGLEGWSVRQLGRPGADDLEDLTRLPDGRRLAVVESPPRLLAVDGGEVPEARAFARVFADLPLNEGVEALATLADGSLLAIAEAETGGPGAHRAAVLKGDDVVRLTWRAPPGFRPTAADRLGPWLLVLERRLSLLGGLEARIVALDLTQAALVAGAELEGRELARLGAGSIAENFEGLAATEGTAGAIDLYLVSDDNFLPLQRTLLLQLRWRPRGRVRRVASWPRRGGGASARARSAGRPSRPRADRRRARRPSRSS
jgi:hypothetical protein